MGETDKLLIQQISAGDKQALAALYHAYERPVYRFIVSRLNDPHEAADILHDVFMDIWRVAGSFEGRSQVKTWIFGIAYRKVIDVHRKRARVNVTDEVPETGDIQDAADTGYAAQEEAAHMRYCVGTLSDEHRTAISLVFYDDMTCAEISEIAGVPEGTVKSRLHHAKKLLLRCMTARIGARVVA